MNTSLRRMVVKAEGRYLRAEEEDRARSWAMGMRSRIELHGRIRDAEDRVVAAATAEFVEQQPNMAAVVPHFAEKVARDYRLFLRYVAHCVVRDDIEFFRRAYAEWIAELLAGMTDPAVLGSGYEILRRVVESELDPSDARAIVPYIELFTAELESFE